METVFSPDDGTRLAASADGTPAIAPAQRQQVERAAEGFEALFIKEMLAQMRKATRSMAGPDSIFADSINSDMLDFADMAIAEQLARERRFGISEVLIAQLLPQNAAPPLKETPAAVAYSPVQAGAGSELAAFAMPVNLPFRQ